MEKNKKIVYIILILMILMYYILGNIINNNVYATTVRQRVTNLDGLSETKYPGIASLINNLKSSHPNWTFTILYTGLDWNTVIYNETEAWHGRSLVQNSSAEWVCATCGQTPYDSGYWYCASKPAVAYYMDIRNWLTDGYIFAFETLSYDEATQTIDGVKKILAGTFMDKETVTYIDTSGNTQVINKSYAQIIMDAAKEAGISPYHLASRVKQEQGKGNSGLISGNYTYTDSNGYTCTDLIGYYNYFNIGAAGSGEATIIKNGLTYAKNKGWSNPELAIKGGATFLASNYISNYQDCLYLEKYQVDSAGGLYAHQYMQNISAPYSEGYSTYTAYRDLDMLNYSFNFIIPVYENMPQIISPMPGAVETNIVTENVKVTTSYADLKIRQNASSSGAIIGYAPKGTILLRIEKATAMSSDGRYWDKVVYDTGTGIIVGYSARTETDGAQYLTLIDDVVTVNEEMQVAEDNVNLRNGPGLTGTTIKQMVSSGFKLTVIDKIPYIIDNYYWYRVKLPNGVQGYIASDYLCAVGEEPPKEPEEVFDNYKLTGDKLVIAPGTEIANIEGATLNGEVLGTGAKVTLNSNEYVLVVLGDANGDGNITPLDYVKVKNHIMNISTLSDCYKTAGDVNGDGNITPLDYVKIKNHIMNVNKIEL